MNLHLQGHWSNAQAIASEGSQCLCKCPSLRTRRRELRPRGFLPVHGHGRLPTVDAVFPQAIEFSDHAVSFPEEVDAAEERATAVVENSLQLR